MKRLANILGATALLLFGGTASATTPASAPLLLTGVEIDGGGVTGDPVIGFLHFAGNPSTKVCGAANLGILNGSNEQIKAMASLATSAFLAGKTVSVVLGGCTPSFTDNAGNTGSYARVVNLIVGS